MNKIFLSQIKNIKKDSIRCKKIFSSNSKNKKKERYISTDNLLFDFSRNVIDDKTLKNLTNLASIIDIKAQFKKMCSGDYFNNSEQRRVLHPAMRNTFFSLDKEIIKSIKFHKTQLKNISNGVNKGEIKSFSQKKFTDVVSIGTGGSYFGINMVYEALKNYSKANINLHFISNLDSTESVDILKNLDPQKTLFIVVSKSFRTSEIIENVKHIKKWLSDMTINKNIMSNFVAVTENVDAAKSLGIKEKNIIALWDWIGGRFSIWTGVSIGLIITIGYDNFLKFLKGAYKGDSHFYNCKYEKNIPVIMGLLSFYYTKFFNAQSHLILPYNHRLRFFHDHIQQLEMESNGKSIDKNGKKFTNISGNIVWGATGNCAQHSFFQLLHQGNTIIPADFIISCKSDSKNQDNHDKLFSNFLSHIDILFDGFNAVEARNLYNKNFSKSGLAEELVIKNLELKGKKPNNVFLLNKLNPESLGELISYYEHKTFVLGLLTNVNSFDQWAVEIGKVKANDIYKDIRNTKKNKKKVKNLLIRRYLD